MDKFNYPCTTEVVGLAMPRYCLFGDTIKTANRIESSGKAGFIQISEKTNELLKKIGGFVTEPRGEVSIKGKGVINTFWLCSSTKSLNHIDIVYLQKMTNGIDDRNVTK